MVTDGAAVNSARYSASAVASDSQCFSFWQEHQDYGGGDTPTAAYEDLLRRFRLRTDDVGH